MSLHDPLNLRLPALKIEKKEDRRLIEEDIAVKNLIDSKLLLDKRLNQLLVNFLGITKEINELLEKRGEYRLLGLSTRNRNYRYKLHNRYIKYDSYSHLEWKLVHNLKKGTKAQREELKAEIEKTMKEKRKKINKDLKNKIKELSNLLQSELDAFEKKHKIKLNILQSLNLHLCKDCKKILDLDRFHSTTCDCGKSISNPLDCEIIVIHQFGEKIIQFIEDNIWLEHGIDYLLRMKNFETLCGFYILGHSSIEHEIDNVGEMNSEKLRIFCECKNKDIYVKDIFIFAGKMADIGCTRGYIFTTSFETHKEVIHLARSKNITIIEQVLEKDDKKLIKEIKEGSKNS